MNGQMLEAEKEFSFFRGKARKFGRNGGDKAHKSERYTAIKSQMINVQ
jgi:GTP-dependent phosphoenolpyruvate carboxykinase